MPINVICMSLDVQIKAINSVIINLADEGIIYEN